MPLPLIPIAVVSVGASLGLWTFSKAADKGSDLVGSTTKLLLAGVAGAVVVHYLKG